VLLGALVMVIWRTLVTLFVKVPGVKLRMRLLVTFVAEPVRPRLVLKTKPVTLVGVELLTKLAVAWVTLVTGRLEKEI